VPSRPSWNTPYTVLEFALTAGILGPLLVMVVATGASPWLRAAAATMGGGQFIVLALRFFRCIASDRLELRGTARLLSTVLASRVLARGALLALGAVVIPLLIGPSPVAVACALAGEILGRYLFFVSVVPRHLAAPYVAAASEAA
jgi:DMSO reductase anchor subunit